MTRGHVAWWRSGRALDNGSRVRVPAAELSGCNPGEVVHTYVPLLPSCIIWYRPMSGDAERLRRKLYSSGVRWLYVTDNSGLSS